MFSYLLSLLPASYKRTAYEFLREFLHPAVEDITLTGSTASVQACKCMLTVAGVQHDVVDDDTVGKHAHMLVDDVTIDDPIAMLTLCGRASYHTPGDMLFSAQIQQLSSRLLAAVDVFAVVDAALQHDEFLLTADKPTTADFLAYTLMSDDEPPQERESLHAYWTRMHSLCVTQWKTKLE